MKDGVFDPLKPTGFRKVRKRRVFYIPGFDPMPPRRYRELYRTESAKQARISGYEIDQKQARGDQFGWLVRGAFPESEPVVSKIEVLLWSDIVRASMDGGIFKTYLGLFKTAWIYLSTGTLNRLMHLGKGPIIAALYPIVFLLVQVLLSALVAWAVGATISAISAPGVGWIVALPLFFILLRLWRRFDDRFYAYYLMQDYAHAAGGWGAYPSDLEQRLGEFRATIAAALKGEADEVLVVGHSSGAHLAVSVLSELIQAGELPEDGPALSLLTLGQVVPMVSFLPMAHRLRRDLRFLSEQSDITWIDISAPGDGCCFALCDPVAVSGVAGENTQWPLVVSAAFSRTLSETQQEALKRRYFRLHFQYLCAFENPGDYDYFAITAGPKTLGERYFGRKPSQSRIDVPASKYTSLVP